MTSWAILVLALVAAASLGYGLSAPVRRLALAWGAVDVPDQRKIHAAPIPRLGGVAVALAVGAVAVAAVVLDPGTRAVVAAAGLKAWLAGGAVALILFTGIADDVRGVGAATKLALELLAALLALIAIGGVPAIRLLPGGPVIALGVAGSVLGMVWIAALTNAVNMLDVADGVAAGTGAISALALGAAAWRLGNPGAAVLAVPLAGALAGFLPHNLRRRLFLGDSGSLLIGFVLGSMSLAGVRQDGAVVVLPVVLAAAVPLAEIGLTLLRRVLRAVTVVRPGSTRERFLLETGRFGFFTPDRRHIAHRLLDIGFAPPAALGALLGGAAVFGALAVATVGRPGLGLVALVVLLATLLYAAPRWLYEELRLLDRGALLPLLESAPVRSRATRIALDGFLVALALTVAAVATVTTPTARDVGLGIVGTLLGFRLAGLYRGSYRHAGMAEAARAVRAVVVGGLLGAAVVQAAPGKGPSPAFWLIEAYVLLTLVVGARLSFRVLEYVYQRGQSGDRRAAILGTDRAAALALRELLATPALGMQPVAFVDGAPGGGSFHGYPVLPANGTVSGSLAAVGATDLVVPESPGIEASLAAVRPACDALGVRIVRFAVRWAAADA